LGLRIATWNVNSVRIRLDGVARLVAEEAPDVICLQEIKVESEAFPLAPFAALGYRHHVLYGIKAYHGVAILSRLPFKSSGTYDWCDRSDGRHVHATLEDGTELHNLYVPAGGDVPDPDENDKFAHKLQFLRELAGWWKRLKPGQARRVLVGDLNVAPLETDVWSHKQLLDVVSHTPIEVEHLERLQSAHRWVDAVRHFVPAEQKLFSWWSYRAQDWSASDRGRRLDHVWVTPALVPHLKEARVLRQARGWEAPSDHVPVVVEIA
jgi:exodeoxyribonuclease III